MKSRTRDPWLETDFYLYGLVLVSFLMLKKFSPIQFPKDEQKHDCIIEWWYFNGNLQDKNGKKYSYMNCLFKADVMRVKIPFLGSNTASIISKIPLINRIKPKYIYFAHSLLTEVDDGIFHSSVGYFSKISKDSFKKKMLYVSYKNDLNILRGKSCLIKESKKFQYQVRNDTIDLKLISKKKPLMEGGDGFLNLGPKKSTYYYSLTDLNTSGTISIDKKEVRVRGKSWMDHQWADVSYSQDFWTWFSLQLDSGVELVVFEYRNGKSSEGHFLASISNKDGKCEHYSKVKLTPLGVKHASGKSGIKYPLKWWITIPQRNIDLNVEALTQNQEMMFGAINYWEGPLKVQGYIGSREVKGSGFMELVGYR